MLKIYIDFWLPVIPYGMPAVAIHQIDCRKRTYTTQSLQLQYNLIVCECVCVWVCGVRVCVGVHTGRVSVVQRLMLRRAKRTNKLSADWFIEMTIRFLFLLLLHNTLNQPFEHLENVLLR